MEFKTYTRRPPPLQCYISVWVNSELSFFKVHIPYDVKYERTSCTCPMVPANITDD